MHGASPATHFLRQPPSCPTSLGTPPGFPRAPPGDQPGGGRCVPRTGAAAFFWTRCRRCATGMRVTRKSQAKISTNLSQTKKRKSKVASLLCARIASMHASATTQHVCMLRGPWAVYTPHRRAIARCDREAAAPQLMRDPNSPYSPWRPTMACVWVARPAPLPGDSGPRGPTSGV